VQVTSCGLPVFTTKSPTSVTTSPTLAPTPQDCVIFSNLFADKDGVDYNGRWEPLGTVNGFSYYGKQGVSSVSRDRFLCYESGRGRWIITAALCDYSYWERWAYCRITTDDISECDDNWVVYTKRNWVTMYWTDNDMSVSTCAEQAAFTIEDCLANTGLDANVCVHSNRSDVLWNGIKTFVNYDKYPCKNERPVYEHTVYNESIFWTNIIYIIMSLIRAQNGFYPMRVIHR